MVNSRPVTSKQRSVTVKSTKPPTVLGKPAPPKKYKPEEMKKDLASKKNDPEYQAKQKATVAARDAKKKADAETAAILKKKGIIVNKDNIAGYQRTMKKK